MRRAGPAPGVASIADELVDAVALDRGQIEPVAAPFGRSRASARTVGIMTLLRRLLAGFRYDIRRRRNGDPEGYIPAFDPTLPKATVTYSSGGRRHRRDRQPHVHRHHTSAVLG
jgi:hypothetical protein